MSRTLKNEPTAEAIERRLEELKERLTTVNKAIAQLHRLAVLQGYVGGNKKA